MASTPSHGNHQDEIREEIDSFLDRNFPLHYETFTNTIVHKLDQLLSKSQEQVYSHVLGYLSSHLMNAIDQKWTEHVRVSPGKFITNTQKKHAMIIDEINAIQEGFIVSYFQDLCEKVVSGATEALSFCKDKSFKLTTFVSEYLQDDDLEVDDKLSTARTKRRTSITTGQPEFKVVRESIEEIDETSELEDLKYMVAYGPLNEEDFTFDKYIKKNQRLQKYEEGHFIQDLNKKSFEASWKEEYEVLERLTTTRDSLEMCYSDPRVQTLNRYSDVVPYKKNCVRLTPVFSGIHSYINASYVSSSFKTDSKSFIVCQAPLESTKQDFWAMVLQENVHTIVMLCKLKTDSRPQSSDYFGESTKIEFPWLKTKIQKVETPMLYLTKRTITLKTSNGIKRTVTHFQWEGWPDHGVPSDDQFDVLIYMVKEMMRRKKENKAPIIVHCSAGIGRSGALVAVHNLAQIIKKSQLNIGKESGVTIDRLSVFSTVRRLRLERFGMVQTAQQYQLIYKLVACLLKNPKLLG